MQVLVSTDDAINCDGELVQRIEGVVEGALNGFEEQVTCVEVRLSDLNSIDPVDRDKSCSMEAHVDGLAAVLETHDAVTLTEAIHGAADKLKRTMAREIRSLRETRQSSLSK